jgi:hypothetical protein
MSKCKIFTIIKLRPSYLGQLTSFDRHFNDLNNVCHSNTLVIHAPSIWINIERPQVLHSARKTLQSNKNRNGQYEYISTCVILAETERPNLYHLYCLNGGIHPSIPQDLTRFFVRNRRHKSYNLPHIMKRAC